jgi:hypothetical protein
VVHLVIGQLYMNILPNILRCWATKVSSIRLLGAFLKSSSYSIGLEQRARNIENVLT